jgi:hypothetical protein
MDLINFISIAIFLFILFDIVIIFVIWKKRKNISHEWKKDIHKHLQKLHTLPENNQILEYDKILDLCLKKKGYQGTLGSKMKQYNNKFYNENAIWNAHKLRNKIAHEIQFHATKKEYETSIQSFKKEILLMIK